MVSDAAVRALGESVPPLPAKGTANGSGLSQLVWTGHPQKCAWLAVM